MTRLRLVALLVAACAAPLTADPLREQQFAIDALQVLRGAKLNRPPGSTSTPVAVIGEKHPATDIAGLLKSNASKAFAALELTAWVVSLPESGDASKVLGKGVVAVIVVRTSARSLKALDAYAVTRNVLTISMRPQDIGKVGIVILPAGIWRDDDRLNEAQVTLEPAILNRSKPRAKDEWQALYVRASKLRQQQRSDTDWDEVAKSYAEAILAKSDEDHRPVPSGNGGLNDPYVPHFRLSQALAMIGDCDGAKEELQHSTPAARKY